MISKLYISFLIFCFLAVSCTIRYNVRSEVPFAEFRKGNYTGVIDTDSKKVIIPAKYGWVREYITGWARERIFYIATDLQYNRFLYNSDGEIIYTFKSNDDDEIEDLFTHNGKLYLILCDFDIEVEYPEKKDYRLLRIDKEAKELLAYPYIQRLGVKNLIYMWDSQHSDSIGFLDINTDRKIIGSHQDFYSRAYVEGKNEVWIKKQDKVTRKVNLYFDEIIDSTLTIRPNPIKNISNISEINFQQ